VVAAVGIAGLFGSVLTSFATTEITFADVGVVDLILVIIGGLLGVVGPFISWLIIGALFFIGSLIFAGDGEFRDLLAAIGWGFAPRVLVPIVGGIIAFVFTPGASITDPQQIQQAVQSPGAIITYVVNTGAYVWAGVIWTYAVARVRNISIRGAAVVVGAVVVIEILLNVGLPIIAAFLLESVLESTPTL
jgi:Yip1 domain.